MRHVLAPVAGAAAILAAVTLAAAAIGFVLKPPTRDVVLAAREVQVLDRTQNGGAEIDLAGRSLDATCWPSGRAALVSFDTGAHILVRGTHVTAHATFAPRLLAAAADLSGVHRLLAAELADRVRTTPHVIDGAARWRGRPVLLLRLGGNYPRVDLVVDRATLEPLAVRFRGRRISGSSRLLPPHPAGGPLIGLGRTGC